MQYSSDNVDENKIFAHNSGDHDAVLTREEMRKNEKEPRRDLSGLSVGLGKYFPVRMYIYTKAGNIISDDEYDRLASSSYQSGDIDICMESKWVKVIIP